MRSSPTKLFKLGGTTCGNHWCGKNHDSNRTTKTTERQSGHQKQSTSNFLITMVARINILSKDVKSEVQKYNRSKYLLQKLGSTTGSSKVCFQSWFWFVISYFLHCDSIMIVRKVFPLRTDIMWRVCLSQTKQDHFNWVQTIERFLLHMSEFLLNFVEAD